MFELGKLLYIKKKNIKCIRLNCLTTRLCLLYLRMILSTNICKNKKDDINQKHSSKKNHRLSYQPERGTKSHNLDITRLKNKPSTKVCLLHICRF